MSENNFKLHHDINSAISSLVNALDLISLEWKDNQELVEKIIPLSQSKLNELDKLLKDFYQVKE